MYNLTNINTIKKILKKYNFKFSKSLGQNFIINPEVCPMMASESIKHSTAYKISETCVIEVGPGIGVLTKELAKIYDKVLAIEFDSRLLPILDHTLNEFNNIKIINKDILKIDIDDLITSEFKNIDKVNICANLPYYIATEFIIKILYETTNVKNLVLMVQKEVAERICAAPGNKSYGVLSVLVQYYADCKILFNIPNEYFIPKPKVESSVISIDINREKFFMDEKLRLLFIKIVKTAFSQRRKTILNSLSSDINFSKDDINKILHDINISPNIRAESLPIQDFIKITQKFYSK